MNQEEWRDVIGYEGYYQVSDRGRVRSIDRLAKGRWTKTQLLKGRILKTRMCTAGYEKVIFVINKKGKTFRVHRLVAQAFIQNVENKKCVNHIDGNKFNNNIMNLEWCTYSENMTHYYNKLYKGQLKGIVKKKRTI